MRLAYLSCCFFFFDFTKLLWRVKTIGTIRSGCLIVGLKVEEKQLPRWRDVPPCEAMKDSSIVCFRHELSMKIPEVFCQRTFKGANASGSHVELGGAFN